MDWFDLTYCCLPLTRLQFRDSQGREMRFGLTSTFSPRPATSRLATLYCLLIGTEPSLDRRSLGPVIFDKHNSQPSHRAGQLSHEALGVRRHGVADRVKLHLD